MSRFAKHQSGDLFMLALARRWCLRVERFKKAIYGQWNTCFLQQACWWRGCFRCSIGIPSFQTDEEFMVLGSLPLAARTIFMAKLAASTTVLSVSVLALNVFTGLLWPLYFPAAGGVVAILRSFGAYWITILAAAVFPFLLVVTVHGLASQVLPRQHFLRLASFIQIAALCFFLGIYILEPSLETPGLLGAPENQRLLAWLPTYWFLGLFHQLDGYTGPSQQIFTVLAERAWIALAVVVPGAVIILLLSYFRALRKIVEEPEITPSYRPLMWTPIRGHSLTRALLSFCLRTLLRSRVHRAILSFYLGIGFALVLSYIRVAYIRELLSDSCPLNGGSAATCGKHSDAMRRDRRHADSGRNSCSIAG